MATSSPIVTITMRRTLPLSTGRMMAVWIPIPPKNEMTSVAANAGQ